MSIEPDLGSVAIAQPDERWPRLFAAERRALESLRTLIDIEHFGSTAVPGLAAKPVIDIMASVVRLASLDRQERALASRGYRLLDVGFAKRRFYRKQDVAPGIAANLHVVTADRWKDKGERLFRDWLVKHPETAHRYALLKTPQPTPTRRPSSFGRSLTSRAKIVDCHRRSTGASETAMSAIPPLRSFRKSARG